MKTQTLFPKTDVPVARFKLKSRYMLYPRHIEIPKGDSMTVPDEAYNIRDLVTRYANGLDPSITRKGEYWGEDDEVTHDAPDLAKIARADLAVQTAVSEHIAQRREMFDQQQRALKREKEAAEKADKPQRLDGKLTDTDKGDGGKIPVKVEKAKRPISDTDAE